MNFLGWRDGKNYCFSHCRLFSLLTIMWFSSSLDFCCDASAEKWAGLEYFHKLFFYLKNYKILPQVPHFQYKILP